MRALKGCQVAAPMLVSAAPRDACIQGRREAAQFAGSRGLSGPAGTRSEAVAQSHPLQQLNLSPSLFMPCDVGEQFYWGT